MVEMCVSFDFINERETSCGGGDVLILASILELILYFCLFAGGWAIFYRLLTRKNKPDEDSWEETVRMRLGKNKK